MTILPPSHRYGPESCRRLSIGTRLAGMRMMRVYLTPSAGVMVDASDVPPANKLLQWMLAWTPAPRGIYLEAAYRHVPEFVMQVQLSRSRFPQLAPVAGTADAPFAADGLFSQLYDPELDDEVLGNSDERMRMSLEAAVVESLDALLCLGPLAAGGGEAVQRVALYFLQMMALRGPHLRKPVEHALSAFLRAQPQFCGHFFKLSVVDYA